MRKLIVCILAMAGLAAAAWAGRMGYRAWKQEHLLKQAHYFLGKADMANTVLCLQKAIQANPKNVDACRMFADLAEMGHARSAVMWRRHVTELEPGVAKDRFDWAKTALSFGDLASANEALASVNEAGKQTADYHKDLAALAWALKKYPEAETNYLEAIRLEPTNLVSRLNLATVQLVSSDSAHANQGRLSLEQLSANTPLRCQALRELTQDAVRSQGMDRAISYSAELLKDPQCTFADRLLRLEVLNLAKSPQFPSYLSSLQQESATNGLKTYDLGRWMFANGRTNEVITWIHTLPANIQTNLPVPLLTADTLIALNRWADLDALTKGQNWKDFEYLRHAFNARALRGKGNAMGASTEWQTALRAGAKRLEALNDLVRRTAGWGWETEMDEGLWAIIDNFPLDREAFLVLYSRLFKAGNTAGLHSLLSKTSAAVPSNTELENNLALVSLLLNSQETKAHDLAHDVYIKDPKNPYYLSTYAYSLFLQHKSNEALKLFDSLPSQQLTNTAVATYYGIILTGAGKREQAAPYLQLAGGAKLLPEERSLVKKAKEGI